MRESAADVEWAAYAREMPRPPGRMRRFWSRHTWLVDVLLAVGYLAFSTFWAVVTPLSSGVWVPVEPIALELIFSVISAGGLLLRRRHPWVVFGVFSAMAVVAFAANVRTEPIGVALALYALFVYRSNRSGWIAFGVIVVTGTILFPALDWLRSTGTTGGAASVPSSVLLLLVTLIAALLGVSAGDRRRYIGSILDRANQLARERDQQARIATLAERERITRELHDVIAHSISVMVSLADGADAIAEKEPQRSRSAIREVGDVGRQSLVEMRQLLGALGDDLAGGEERTPLPPSPGLPELGSLTDTFRSAGLPITLRTAGTAPYSPALQNTIHRIVQESLTNALRYAKDPREVLVVLDFRGSAVTVDVSDDGRLEAPAASVGSGRGIVGIRERARLAGGTAQAGPMPAGGWRVHVEIPHQEDEA